MIELPFVMALKLMIRNLMLEKGISQRALAASVGSSPQLVAPREDEDER